MIIISKFNANSSMIQIYVEMVTGHNGHKPKRPQPKRPQTETATNRNSHKPERPQTETATNRSGHKPERPQTETATNRNDHRPKRLQTETATDRNGNKPERPHQLSPISCHQNKYDGESSTWFFLLNLVFLYVIEYWINVQYVFLWTHFHV